MRARLSGKLRADIVSSAAGAASGTGAPRLARADAAAPSPSTATKALAWVSGIGIGSSILIMIVASAARHSAAVPLMPWPPGFPPLEIRGHLPLRAVYLAPHWCSHSKGSLRQRQPALLLERGRLDREENLFHIGAAPF